MSVAETILKQLGGSNRLVVMVGAHNFIDVGDGLSFKIKFKGSKANYIKIQLNSMDLYDIEFGKIRGFKYKIVSTASGVYVSDMKHIIEQTCEIYLSL